MSPPSGALIVFAKAPEPGQVKTRLCPPFHLEQACEFYACMLDDVVEHSAQQASRLGLLPILAVHPPQAQSAMARRSPRGFRVISQHGCDLAARMSWAAAEAGAMGASPILLRGSDSPALAAATLQAACEALHEVDVVLCPDSDGGYNLVGLRQPAAGLFDHPMSHAQVLEQTLANAKALGLRASLLEPGFDVDVAADLEELAKARSAGPLPCPRTLQYLDEHDLWPATGR